MSPNVNNIKYEDFKNICRMCMFNCDIKFFQDSVVSNIFYKLTDFRFETNDDLPKQICLKCFEKINEIHEFAFQCKQTHTALTECLNNSEKLSPKEQQNGSIEKRYELLIILDKNLTIDKYKSECIKNNNLNSTDNNVSDNNQIEIKQEIIEETNNEYNDDIIPELSELNNNQNINYSVDNLSNTSNIDIKNEAISNHKANLNDIKENVNSSNCSDISIINLEEINKNKNKMYKCDVCNETFDYLILFKQHKKLHKTENPYNCDQCSKSFKYFSTLKIHLRIHSDERPYKCKQCLKSFKCLSNLNTHMLTHSGERLYKCKQCSKSFGQSSNLKAHLRTHTGECPYKCSQCSKSFTQLASLKNHTLTHSKERPYKCSKCAELFKNLYQLKQHIRTPHKSN